MTTSSTASRNSRLTALNTLLAAGSGTYPTMKIRNASTTTLVSVDLDATNPIATPSAGVAELNPPAGEATWIDYTKTPSVSGTASDVVLCDKDGNVIETATIGVSGTEMIINTLTISTTIDVKFTATPTLTALA